MNENILVTGGAGYIGSHTCRALARAGFVPVTVDDLSCGHKWAVQWGPLEQGDVRDVDFLNAVFAKYRPAAVMHFAGRIMVGESVSDPALYYANNIGGTLILLEAMRRSPCTKVVFSSTAAVYGAPENVSMDESHPTRPANPYGRTKLMMEQALRDYCSAYGMCAVVFRYFNAAGAAPDAAIGEAHIPETHLIPLAIQSAFGQAPPLRIFGSDYDTPDGTAIRDYIHVCDIADAHVLALRELLGGGQGGVYNLGSEQGMSVREIVDAVRDVCGKEVPYIEASRREGDVPRLVADADAARRQLGWSPAMTDIETIVRTAMDWHRKNK